MRSGRRSSRDVDAQLLTGIAVAGNGADKVMLSGALEGDISRPCGCHGNGIGSIASIISFLCHLAYIMSSSSKAEGCIKFIK